MENVNLWIYGAIAIIAIGVVIGFGEKRKIVVFKDYNDLFISFSVPVASYLGLVMLSSSKEDAGIVYLMLSALFFIIAIFLLFVSAKNSYGPIGEV